MSFRAVASLLLGSVALAGGLASGLAVNSSGGPPDVRVPNVLGLPALKAAYRIGFAHLDPVCRDVHRRGTVVEQHPAAGEEVPRRSMVTIYSGDDGCPTVKFAPIATSTTTTVPATSATTRTVAEPPGLNPIPRGAILHAITVAFVNLTIGYVLASATKGDACEIAVEKTTDGGADLGQAVPVAPCSQFTLGMTGSARLARLAVDDHGDGFVYGKVLYMTHDGGSAWQAVSEPGRVLDVEVVGSSVWMFVSQCKTPGCSLALMESTDGGASWHRSPLEPPILATTTDPQLVRVTTPSAYVVTAPRSNAFGEPDTVPMWFTPDGGRSWVQRSIPCPVDSFDVVMAAAPTGKLFAVCAAQPAVGSEPKSIVDSTDGGVTWSSVGPCTTALVKGECTAKSLINGYLGTLVSPAPTVVYLTGHRSPLYMTTDGGVTWSSVGGTPGNTALTFFNQEDGLMLSDDFTGTLSRTDDGGATWSKVTLDRMS